MNHSMPFWAGFAALVMVLLTLDLGVFNKKVHAPSMKEAVLQSLFYIVVSCLFGGFVYWQLGYQSALEFFTAYIIEESMSVDNLFMFVVIFAYFKVPAAYHHRVLFWGVMGAIVMRLGFILAGAALVSMFHPVLYIFALFLLYLAWKIMFADESDSKYEENRLVKFVTKHLPVTQHFDGHNFMTKVEEGGKLVTKLTPLFLALVAVETTDLVFAADSIPACFAVSKDPFILVTSNVCAVLGLRALYFVVEALLAKLPYLKKALAVILAFVGVKMLIEGEHIHIPGTHIDIPWFNITIPIATSLAVIAGVLGLSVIASFIWPRKEAGKDALRKP
ncbi:MAG: TerC family protein [Candidatus Melainabacteria bacterium]|nr:TerC family protein [Candidatus Melainabacteria bacterium]